MKTYMILSLEDFPLICPGDDIAKMIVDTAEKNGVIIEHGDIVVVAQKIVSKSENRVVDLKNIIPSKNAEQMAKKTGKSRKFVELVLSETKRVLKASPEAFLVEDIRGLICINAGIDKSNVVGRGRFALLPKNPDASAQKCRLDIKKLTGKTVAVIVCDTYSRPFRRGQVNFAIGVSGINPFKDYRGKKDLFGQILKVKNIAIVDEIAAAAEILMGQAKEATPVAIIRGIADIVESEEKHEISELQISREEDLFKGAL